MKAITASRLADGAVVYLGCAGDWVQDPSCAAKFDDRAASVALAASKERSREIADAWLIDLDEAGCPAGRDALKERIRMTGPSVRPDLGRRVGHI